MKKSSIFTFLALFTTSLLGIVCLAVETSYTKSTVTYDVTGYLRNMPGLSSNCDGLWNPRGTPDIGLPTPVMGIGGCSWEVEATLKDVDIVLLKITFTLPVWVDQSAACAACGVEWNRARGVLVIHENGHEDIHKNFNKQPYVDELKAVKVTGTGQTQDKAKADADKKVREEATKIFKDKFLVAVKAEQTVYENNTNHGKTQGPGLTTIMAIPSTCTCPP